MFERLLSRNIEYERGRPVPYAAGWLHTEIMDREFLPITGPGAQIPARISRYRQGSDHRASSRDQ